MQYLSCSYSHPGNCCSGNHCRDLSAPRGRVLGCARTITKHLLGSRAIRKSPKEPMVSIETEKFNKSSHPAALILRKLSSREMINRVRGSLPQLCETKPVKRPTVEQTGPLYPEKMSQSWIYLVGIMIQLGFFSM